MDVRYHDPVLLEESVGFLVTDLTGTYVDGTLGGGGHSEAICRKLAEHGRLIGFDADEDAIVFATERLSVFGSRFTAVHGNFKNLRAELGARGVSSIRGLLLDLGVSSHQLEEGSKGFSFRADERIDMRMNRRQPYSGWDVVNTSAEEKLADILYNYGEERKSRRIARVIIAGRPIDTTGQLAEVVERAIGGRHLTKSLARVFQAIRIETNKELENLEQALSDSLDLLEVGGRIVVLSYHSLEDRIVKHFFKNESATSVRSGSKYIPDTVVTPRLRMVTRSPVVPGEAETSRNPRARSAKLRVAERV